MITAGRAVFALAMLAGEVDAAASCSREESVNAAAGASDARDWDALYDAFHRFGHCEERMVAAGFAHSVVWLLASRCHIDATADEPDLRRIIARTTACPGHARPLCREIDQRARAALREMGKE